MGTDGFVFLFFCMCCVFVSLISCFLIFFDPTILHKDGGDHSPIYVNASYFEWRVHSGACVFVFLEACNTVAYPNFGDGSGWWR